LIRNISNSRSGIAAIIALGQIGSTEAVLPLTKLFDQLLGSLFNNNSTKYEYLDSGNLKVCRTIATALGRIQDYRAVNSLIKASTIKKLPKDLETSVLTALKKINKARSL
jgi:HEAT repeat protein